MLRLLFYQYALPLSTRGRTKQQPEFLVMVQAEVAFAVLPGLLHAIHRQSAKHVALQPVTTR